MEYHFTASRVSGESNAVFPNELIIDDCKKVVIYRKPRLIGCQEMKVRFAAIGSVSVDKHLLFADVIIETNGGRIIKAKGFSRYDAEEIADLLGN